MHSENPASRYLTSNENALPEVQAVLKYLQELPSKTENRVLSGQNCGHGDELTDPKGYNSYNHYIEELHAKTGKYVAILSIDYEYMAIYSPQQIHAANAYLIDYWKNGGLIAINYTPRNPFADNGSGDPQQSSKSKVKIAKLLDPESAEHTAWRQRMDVIATGLAELRDAGVVVLWRPMQEMNGTWFWYASKPEYKTLWIDMHDYFTNEKSLNNLLWVYDTAEAVALNNSTYPGDTYVDIVGNNPYSDTFTMVNNYKGLSKFGKVMCCAESGFDLNTTTKPKDLNALIKALEKYPAIAYFVEWHNCGPNAMISLVDSKNADQLLNHPIIVTRDEVNWKEYLK